MPTLMVSNAGAVVSNMIPLRNFTRRSTLVDHPAQMRRVYV
ncbi:hypothetical protein ACVMII_000799 [Bradyrhizobium diazoefficiens]